MFHRIVYVKGPVIGYKIGEKIYAPEDVRVIRICHHRDWRNLLPYWFRWLFNIRYKP